MFRLLFIASIFSFSAVAHDSGEEWARADWLRHSFFAKSISDTMFTPDFETTIPPIQVIRRPIAKDSTKQMNELKSKIFLSLGFTDQVAQRTFNDNLRLNAGPTGNLSGRVFERTGVEGNDKFIYCAGFIRDGHRLHAIYFKTFQDIEASCLHGLTSLSKSKALYQ